MKKQVRGREVVLRHGGGNRGYLLHVTALHKILRLSQNFRGSAALENKKKMSRVERGISGGGRHGGQKS
jgi:hypothetical protein